MSVVWVVLGGVLVVGMAVDIGLTVLHPTIPGPASLRLNRVVWRAVRAVAQAGGRRGLLTFAGPLATLTMLIWWLAGLWLGFALVYLPFVEHFSSSVHLRHEGLFTALYGSASMLTTLGLGDLLPTQHGMRVVVNCEAAFGVGVVSAAISYMLSVYPLATQTRAHALRFSDLRIRTPVGAREFISATGNGGLADIHHQLIQSHQSLRRFPVLYYFHPESEQESVTRLLESVAVLCIVARWAPPEEQTPYARTLADALHATLDRIRADYEDRYVIGQVGTERIHPPSEEELAAALRSIRKDVPGVAAGDEDPREFGRFVAEMDRFLAELAASQLYSHRPLAERLRRASEQL